MTIFIWGDKFLAALALGVVRYPNLLSILSSLTSYPPLGRYLHVHFLIRYNAGMVLVGEIASIFIAWKLHLHWLEASVVGLLAVLLTYRWGINSIMFHGSSLWLLFLSPTKTPDDGWPFELDPENGTVG